MGGIGVANVLIGPVLFQTSLEFTQELSAAVTHHDVGGSKVPDPGSHESRPGSPGRTVETSHHL
eukprot:3417408-Pyramimonas_sp.AAC.1